MSMRTEQFVHGMSVAEVFCRASRIEHYGIVRQAGEIEHHLVNFSLTVASHSDDLLGKAIEHCGNFFWRVLIGQIIAGAMVEKVTKKHNTVRSFGFDSAHEFATPGCRSMNVGCNEKLHGASSVSLGGFGSNTHHTKGDQA